MAYKPKTPAPISCAECGDLITPKPGTGRRPKYCRFCKRLVRNRQQRTWHRLNPERSKEIRKNADWRYLYGLEPDKAKELLSQGCAVCGTYDDLVIDHCHKTGKVRAALCQTDNKTAGLLGDDPTRLRALADYLDSFR